MESIESRRSRKPSPPSAVRPPAAPIAPLTGPTLSLEQIREKLGEGCGTALCETKHKLVFGVGNPKAEIVFVGEGPGADEDEQGIPFIGRAGQLLTKMIEAMGFQREEIYIANVVKCRPPGNRVPQPEEIALCSPFLRLQLNAVHPKLVIALGATAATTLVGHDGALAKVRGTFQPLIWDGAIPVLSTYHPAYLLRNPPAKKIVWEDLKLALAHLGKPIPKSS